MNRTRIRRGQATDPSQGNPDDGTPDPRVSTVPIPTEDGGEVVISQQNVGPGNQVGAGEFKQSGETSLHKDPAIAEREEQRLEEQAPTEAGGAASATGDVEGDDAPGNGTP